MLKKYLHILLSIPFILQVCFVGLPAKSYADSLLGLPDPGTMVDLSPEYAPVLIRGLEVHSNNPLLFDFMVDTGNSGLKIDSLEFKTVSQKLIKYFLTALTIKEDDLWVNLSPYEKDRMVPEDLGKTKMGQDMLAQDYILKQLTASLIYPEKSLGKEFWEQVYTKARQIYGVTNIPAVNTFNKVWIVADKAKVLELNNTAYVINSHLRVMLEEDYMALNKHLKVSPNNFVGDSKFSHGKNPHALASEIIHSIILPQLEIEVNSGKNFATLRQIFYSMILASWYKVEIKNALLNQVYSNKTKISGVLSDDFSIKEKIYQQYLRAYKKGVFNYIKKDAFPYIGQEGKKELILPRRYFSGGEDFAMLSKLEIEHGVSVDKTTAMPSTGDMVKETVVLLRKGEMQGASPANLKKLSWELRNSPIQVWNSKHGGFKFYYVKINAKKTSKGIKNLKLWETEPIKAKSIIGLHHLEAYVQSWYRLVEEHKNDSRFKGAEAFVLKINLDQQIYRSADEVHRLINGVVQDWKAKDIDGRGLIITKQWEDLPVSTALTVGPTKTGPEGAASIDGGIDLTTKSMGLDLFHEGKNIEVNLNPAMIAEFQKEDFTGIDGVIIKIVPIKNPLSILKA